MIDEEQEAEIVIASEKDLPTVGYFYNTKYNPVQPEIVDYQGEFSDDENADRVSDINHYLAAYASSFYIDIPVGFFTQTIPTEGEIKAKITNYDGTTEEITFREDPINIKISWDQYTTKARWVYEAIEENVWGDNIEITVIPYAKNAGTPNGWEENSEYHILKFSDSNAMSFEKFEIFGKTIEFPFNCQAHVGWADSDFYDNIEPIYNDITKVSKVIVNFSDNTSKKYTNDNIFDASEYYGEDSCFYYSSQEIPILYINGAFIINMPDNSFKKQIVSIIVEEDGFATKYNVAENTEIMNSYAWN